MGCTKMRVNEFNQPIGEDLKEFELPKAPTIDVLEGKYCRLEKLSSHHIKRLYHHFKANEDAPNWTYLPDEQPQNYEAFESYIHAKIQMKDPYFFAIINRSDQDVVGMLSLLRINEKNASIEVGHIHYANKMKQTCVATEVHYLLANYIFGTLGYRRYEWKCDALNEASIKAAKRLGFKYEGIFRNHTIYKKRSRDTCWLSMLASEWSEYRMKFENWLDPFNYDEFGIQINKLSL